MDNLDVIIIGGGPAGCTAALSVDKFLNKRKGYVKDYR